MKPQRSRPAPHCQGAFAIMLVPLLVLMVALFGLALDTSLLYNRKAELSGMARAVAFAAASKLDGTTAGIAAAQASARTTAARFTYHYGEAIVWDDAALAFSTSPARDGAWLGGGSIPNPAAHYFAKVDTAALGAGPDRVRTAFMRMFGPALEVVRVADSAVAGRIGIKAVPLAVCAMSETAAAPRTNGDMADTELVEFGFRRGVSYDLMQLNPKGVNPARYMVNPVIPPGATGAILNPPILGPFVCSGTMWMPRLTGAPLRVSPLAANEPLAALHVQLNARFGDYAQNLCHPGGAAPDANVYAFRYDTDNKRVPWMRPEKGAAAATSTTERGRLETVADIPGPGSTLEGLNGGSFGPLWSFTRAARFAAWTPGAAEPEAGYAAFVPGDWARLYRHDIGSVEYPTAHSPYDPKGSSRPTTRETSALHAQYQATNRRLLYLPLLACEAGLPAGANSQASVAGIGKFFMTVPATRDRLIAEFAGAAATQTIPANVELFP